MRWGRLIHDIEDWFDVKIVPLLDGEIGLAKVKEEYRELKAAQKMIELHQRLSATGDYLPPEQVRIMYRHREGEVADLFVALVCFAHANDINLKRAVFATLLKLQKRKWSKTNIPGVVRHVEGT